ncbi:MAG: nuclease-related domain-containing protein [Verrucomicrobia bacterium]|nr:nuclease-related domain-containing protein [Verrucomicrobiota bacterium]
MYYSPILSYVIAFLPLILLSMFVALLYARKWIDEGRWAPASRDTLIRPPGESLRQKIEFFDEQISECLTVILLAVVAQIGGFFLMKAVLIDAALNYSFISITIVTVAFTLYFLTKGAFYFVRRRNYNLGLQGERLVAEHLNLLMLEGYRVFHDLQFEGFSVDHALVGPGGVFAIKTRMRRKRKNLKENHFVKYDGQKLHWPNGRANEFGIKNAINRADSLEQWLTSAVEEAVKVHPVLVFPGWKVESEGEGTVCVLNPKAVSHYLKGIEKYDEVLSDTDINRTAHQLEEISRLPE